MTERISAWASGPSASSSSTSSTSAAMIAVARHQIDQPGALHALDQHANGAVGQLQQLHRGGDDAEIVERVAIGIVLARIELGDEEQLLVGGHRRFERRDRFLAPDEQRNDAVRENDDVAKRKNGEKASHGRVYGRPPLAAQQSARNNPQRIARFRARAGGGDNGRRPRKDQHRPQRASRSTRRLPAPDPEFRTMRSRRARNCREPPSDEEVERDGRETRRSDRRKDTLAAGR